ncbi:MAG: carboxypeptidase-like regulatory domain-containing protein [Chitinophagaceae bacterium]|nr:carboxypeptidase-like regulatory domain-containing protein [Chitinophagaceae bacterium]
MKKLLLLLLLISAVLWAKAVPVKGIIKDFTGNILPYSSIVVKGSFIGTTANNEGKYLLNLPAGRYTLQCMHVGYKMLEKEIMVEAPETTVDFILSMQELTLKEIVIGNNAEDPAYEIIRQAIQKRPYYKDQVEAFECEVYIKGQLKLKDYPATIFGQKVDFSDGDSSRQKMIYLSETIATYSFQKPGKEKAVVTSTRVSGQGESFGFSSPRFITFYDNNIQISNALNPRGFISPIADHALSFYRYKFMGSFQENGRIINRIKVMPRRSFEPLFSGFISIVEDEWRIHSIDLMLTKASQMELADTLRIEHMYVPVTKDVWMIHSQVLYPSVNLLGFDATGSFVTVYSNYNLNPSFKKGFFNNIVLKYDSASNKKPRAFWDTVRPVPLLDDEIMDYIKKDSLELVRRDPAYLDSIDRRKNKFTAGGILVFGQTFSRQSKKSTFSYPPLIEVANFNTVEGFNLNFAPTYARRFSETQSIAFTPTLRYGFTNRHFNADLSGKYVFGKRAHQSVAISGGKRVFQINNENPVRPIVNTYNTLLFGDNFLKIYEARFGELSYVQGVGEGLTIKAYVSYQDRMPLENTDNTFWGKSKNLSRRTPNYPTELVAENFSRHQALTGSITVSYRPGTKYIQLPERRINLGSKYPLFTASYTKGLNGVLGSDIDFDRWKFSVKDDINLKLLGVFDYNISIGGFVNDRRVEIQDYQHFNGNQMLVATEYLNSFQLAPYYARSTTEPLYSTLNVEHHFNGFLTNKIPFVKKLNVYLVGGFNAFVVHKDNYYYEVFGGIENILKFLRVDYVFGFGSNGFRNSATRIGFRVFN